MQDWDGRGTKQSFSFMTPWFVQGWFCPSLKLRYSPLVWMYPQSKWRLLLWCEVMLQCFISLEAVGTWTKILKQRCFNSCLDGVHFCSRMYINDTWEEKIRQSGGWYNLLKAHCYNEARWAPRSFAWIKILWVLVDSKWADFSVDSLQSNLLKSTSRWVIAQGGK